MAECGGTAGELADALALTVLQLPLTGDTDVPRCSGCVQIGWIVASPSINDAVGSSEELSSDGWPLEVAGLTVEVGSEAIDDKDAVIWIIS